MKKQDFDNILKQNVINSNGIDFFGCGNNYPFYYNDHIFDAFKNQMMTEYNNHFRSYSKGKGNELQKNGNKPAKMAQVASSSRFCYLALRNIPDIEFEHACPIIGITGTPPQMDAYMKDNTFIEVKCHEMFDKHQIMLSKQYFNYIFGENNDFGLEFIPKEKMSDFGIKENNSKFEIPFDIMNIRQPEMFDFKQLLCHLLGIKSHKKPNESATFVYLFFKPKTSTEVQQKEIDSVFEKLANEIQEIFNSNPIQKFIQNNNITLKAVAEYAEVMSPLTKENIIYLYS